MTKIIVEIEYPEDVVEGPRAIVDAINKRIGGIAKMALLWSEVDYSVWVEENKKMLPAYLRYKKLMKEMDNHD